ncbi:Hypothetical protein R9X50_00423000 [Acrodontium crateriforme]|uniref:Uncharacterized protein n=1 Tax=Acrodontium crateriforme TaxID=150365 RepID=A0AAQ3M5S6_9PEZI|nr:Hypothetical protein R9X50_00423000 [Acrodontium crateriforme]
MPLYTVGLRVPLPTKLPAQTQRRHASVLFALAALSNSRETQHFNKITRLPRTEHSPTLKLIETSEVKPYPIPLIDVSNTSSRAAGTASLTEGLGIRENDREALILGRALLADHARQRRRWLNSLQAAKSSALKESTEAKQNQEALQREVGRLRKELRDAAFLVVGLVAVATGVAVYQFWPNRAVDSAVLGRQVAERGTQTMATGGGAMPVIVETPEVVIVPAAVPPAPVPVAEASSAAPIQSWWKGLFWKQG